MPKLDKRLRKDIDYLVVDESPTYVRYANETDPAKRFRKSRSVVKVWVAETDEEMYLCRECEQFAHPDSVSPIHSHRKVHTNAKLKAAAEDEHLVLIRVVTAFNLLPAKIQKRLLKQADEQLKGEN